MTSGVRIHGLPALQRRLDRISGTLHRGLDRAHERIAATLVAASQRGRVPRASGALAASVRPERRTAGARVASALPYAGAIHWGVPRGRVRPPWPTAPRPWLADAAKASEGVWLGQYEDELRRLVEQ